MSLLCLHHSPRITIKDPFIKCSHLLTGLDRGRAPRGVGTARGTRVPARVLIPHGARTADRTLIALCLPGGATKETG